VMFVASLSKVEILGEIKRHGRIHTLSSTRLHTSHIGKRSIQIRSTEIREKGCTYKGECLFDRAPQRRVAFSFSREECTVGSAVSTEAHVRSDCLTD
jgi:hypothetical protein